MTSKITSSGYIDAFGNKLFFEREGNPDGRTVLFVHGLGGTTNAFQPLVPDLQDFDIVRFDWSGHGRSPCRPQTSVGSYVEDCEAVIDNLQLKDILLVGHSLGGLISLHLAAKRPEKISALVLFGPVNPPPEAGQRGLKARAASVREGGIVVVADAVAANAFAPVSLQQRRIPVAMAREMLTRSDREGYALACEALANSSPPPFSQVKAKTFVMSGREDKVSTVAAGQSICETLGNLAKQEVWSDVGHWHMLEAPEAAVKAIKRAV